VWDGGSVRTTHQEFGGRARQMDNTSSLSDHATHVAGTMIAAGVRSQARGMAYEAELVAHDWNNDLSEMTARAAARHATKRHRRSSVAGDAALGGSRSCPALSRTGFDGFIVQRSVPS